MLLRARQDRKAPGAQKTHGHEAQVRNRDLRPPRDRAQRIGQPPRHTAAADRRQEPLSRQPDPKQRDLLPLRDRGPRSDRARRIGRLRKPAAVADQRQEPLRRQLLDPKQEPRRNLKRRLEPRAEPRRMRRRGRLLRLDPRQGLKPARRPGQSRRRKQHLLHVPRPDRLRLQNLRLTLRAVRLPLREPLRILSPVVQHHRQGQRRRRGPLRSSIRRPDPHPQLDRHRKSTLRPSPNPGRRLPASLKARRSLNKRVYTCKGRAS